MKKNVEKSKCLRVLLLLTLVMVLTAQLSAGPAYHPVGVSEQWSTYYPNNSADLITGAKAGWSTSLSAVQPVYGMWQNQEHGFIRLKGDRWIFLMMEGNRKYFQSPYAVYADACLFLEFDNLIFEGEVTPSVESEYWRGVTMDSHPFVWAPCGLEHEGVYYNYYTSRDPDTNMLACYLATSTTGEPNPAAWVEYDPDPSTANVVEPLFVGADGMGVKDFHVIKVETEEGTKFYNYFIANPFDVELDIGIAEVRLRISDSPTVFPDSSELSDPVFKKINLEDTRLDRIAVDYENPEIVQYDDGSFYLFIARHGQIPADEPTNPDWEPIPLATEVYWSWDGKSFSNYSQLDNLRSSDGKELNAAVIIRNGDRWFASYSSPSNNLNYYELDDPPFPETPTGHSEIMQRLVESFESSENSLRMIEFVFEEILAATSWEVYE